MSAVPSDARSRSANTRRAIQEAGARLFEEQGIHATTIRQIAQSAHVSVGSVYVHFSGKADLMLHLVLEGLDAVEREVAASRELASPIARVCAAGDAYLRFAADHPVAARYAAIRALEPDGSPEFAELNRVCAERVRRLVMTVAEDVRLAMLGAEIPTTPMQDTMIFLWGLWNGAAALMLRRDELAIPPEAAQRAVEFGREIMQLSAEARAKDA